MPWINGQWVESESGEGVAPGQGMQPGAGFAPGYDPGIGAANEKYAGLDPKYNDFADLYGKSNAYVKQTRDKMMENYGGVDAFGPSTANYNPPGEIAGDVQLQHDIAVQRYNAGLSQAAQGYLRGGLDLFQSYRPGGAASLASGMYGQLANATLAGRLDPLDLMHEDRLDQARKARNRQQKAGLAQGIGSLVGTIGGAIVGGPVGAAVGGQVGGMAGSYIGGGAGQQAYIEQAPQQEGEGSAGEMAGASMGGAPLASQTQPMPGSGYSGPTSPAEMQFGGQSAGGPQARPQGGGGLQTHPYDGGMNFNGVQTQGAGGQQQTGQMQMQGPMGSTQPMGVGPLGMSNEGVAATYEQRYGEPLDVMWARTSSNEMVGFSDTMLARLDVIMAGSLNGA